jgi:hypothetical protein
MDRKTVTYLIETHGIDKLERVVAKDGFQYGRTNHVFRVLSTLSVLEVRRQPLSSSNTEYIDFADISKLLFDTTIDPNDVQLVDGEIEGVQTNEDRRFVFVNENDVGVNYHEASVGQIKQTRTYANGAVVGDPCTVVEFRYKLPNGQNLPDKIRRYSSTVIESDLL